jgi:hypothetical protein
MMYIGCKRVQPHCFTNHFTQDPHYVWCIRHSVTTCRTVSDGPDVVRNFDQMPHLIFVFSVFNLFINYVTTFCFEIVSSNHF